MERAAVTWTFPEIKPITDAEFRRFQTLVQREAGIYLSDVKRALLVGRLARRLRELGLTSFGKYYDCVLESPGELCTMLNFISTNETHFFREPAQFEFLRNRLLPSFIAQRRTSRQIRIWSAACSTGEEPYSIGMVALDAMRTAPEFTVEIFASDISTRVLDRAAAGFYPIKKAEEIPVQYRKVFMLKGRGESKHLMKVGPDLANVVSFGRVNLIGDLSEISGTFDIIFCRNVLIYFQAETKRQVIAKLLSRLRPGGALFLGHSETLHGAPVRMTCPIPNVYLSPSELS